MTKFEWEKELKNNLKRIPKAEADKILDYYNELFYDKAEAGLNERDIVRSFGNPFDVAYKVVYGFENNTETDIAKTETPQTKPKIEKPAQSKTNNSSGIISRLIFFVPFCILTVLLWVLVISFAVTGIGGVLGGIAFAILGLIGGIANGIQVVLFSVGAGLATMGVGIIMLPLIYISGKAAVRLTQKYFFMGKYKVKARRIENE